MTRNEPHTSINWTRFLRTSDWVRKALSPMETQKRTSTKQVFRFKAPTATSVLLAGDFTHWQEKPIPMQKGSGGVWTSAVKLPPGTHHYRFIVDSNWQDDPECTVRVPNPFGGQSMVRQVA